jgi:glycosyltransferase involved in cell wall biosynthesis
MNPINSSALIDLHEGEREKRIVNVGRLTEQKNQKMLIDAFARIKDEFPEYKLEIYGDGELMDKLKSQAVSLGVEDRVVFCGNVNNVGERIRTAEVFAFTSDYEGMPNALAEAMALGLACVSTDCSPGGARMLIEDGVNGIITPCGNADAFADALRRVLSDKQYSRKLGESAVYVRERLKTDNIAGEWESYFKLVINKKNK